MKIKFKEKRYFIDLFSGPGLCWNRDNRRFVQGSSLLALDLKTHFTNYIFIDSNPQTCAVLQARIKHYYPNMEDRIEFLNFNTNWEISNIATHVQRGKALIVAFLDPNAFDIHFSVLERLSTFESIEVPPI